MRQARQLRHALVITLVLLMAASSGIAADQHVVSPQQLASAVGGQVAQQDADRAAIHEALARPEVKDAAKSLSIDLNRVNAAADTLAGADLTKAGDAARQVNQQLVGGSSTVVISTTTIIIALLLIILLIVVIKS
jgi:hypothetical protein